jgi:hypothetical protein
MAELRPVSSAKPLTLENDVPNTAADIACVPRWPTKISDMTVDPYPNKNCKLMGTPSAIHLITPSTRRIAFSVTRAHAHAMARVSTRTESNDQFFRQVLIRQM